MASQPTETTYYEENGVRITSARAVFGSSTYALANITSVAGDHLPANNALPFFMLIGGIGILIAGIVNKEATLCIAAGLLLGVIGGLMMMTRRDKYVVKIGTAGAEQRAYVSEAKAEIEKIVAALNDAIVKRG